MKIFIIHGSYGNPQENWFPWLKQELEKLGHTGFVPGFPTPKNQSLENWERVFEEYIEKVDGNTIFVGHSLGPAFILSVLENLENPKPVKACFFVAGFIGLLNNSEFDGLNRAFSVREFNWSKIKENCQRFYLYHSDNDPYVPLEKAKELSKKLNCELKIIKGAGHFNKTAGYTEFELLLEDIKKELK